ncbi:MAG: acyltransferase, partial [Duncaniella sp.]|nr:acyltransferase [Duncaniella sp.]
DITIPIRLQGVSHKGIVIGKGCWIGAKTTFLDGTELGDGCIVAAGAVVRGKFPSNCIVGGVPAKIIKERK